MTIREYFGVMGTIALAVIGCVIIIFLFVSALCLLLMPISLIEVSWWFLALYPVYLFIWPVYKLLGKFFYPIFEFLFEPRLCKGKYEN